MIVSAWRRPPRGDSTSSTWPEYSTTPTRLPWRVSRRAITPAKSRTRSRLRVRAVPKSTEGDRSSSSQAVISRSSRYWRTYGSPMRAVTFQSM